MDRQYQVSYSTVGFLIAHLDDALEGIASAGFSCIELAVEPHVPDLSDAGAANRIISQLNNHGLRATTVHAPYKRYALGAPNDEWRKESAEALGNSLRFAGQIGASGVVIHPTPSPRLLDPNANPVVLTRTLHDAARRSLDELATIAADAGVRILLENLCFRRAPVEYPFASMHTLRPLVDSYPSEQVGLVLDTGHAWTDRYDPAREIEIAGERLWGTHLQDVDAISPNDNHWLPGQGCLDWPSIRQALNRVNYQGAWTFEVIKPTNGETPGELATKTREFAVSWGLQPPCGASE